MNIKLFLKTHGVRLTLILTFFVIIVPPFFTGTPIGRDWTAYRHPHLEYFAQHGLSLGVLWQQSGGILTSMDPSLMVFDPVYIILNVLLPYPASISLYIVILWLCSMLTAEVFLKKIQITETVRFISVLAYSFGGLSISVATEEFFSLYFFLSIAAWALYRCREKLNVGRFVIAVLSFYYLGYTAAPGVLLTLVVGIYWLLPDKIWKHLFIKVWAYAAIGLIFPYTALFAALYLQVTPSSSDWHIWSFHPFRVVSFFFPDFIRGPDSLEWFDHRLGRLGQVKAYFPSITLPLTTGFGLFLISWNENKSLIKKVILVGGVFLIFSMIGQLPHPFLGILRKLPFFWDRYPEKFLMIAIPLLIVASAKALSVATIAKEHSAFTKYILFVLLSLIVTLIGTQGRFLNYIRALTFETKIVIVIQFLCLFVAMLFPFSEKIRRTFMCISVCFWLPFSYQNIRTNVQPYKTAYELQEEMPEAIVSRLRGESVIFDRSALMNDCIGHNPKDYDVICNKHYSAGSIDLYLYKPYGSIAFQQFQTMPLDLAVVNFKPHYLVVDRTLTQPQKFCSYIMKKNTSILNCKEFKNLKYVGPLSVLEFQHANEVKVLNTTNDYRLDLSVTARFNAVRVPFIVPPGGKIFLDNHPVKREQDSFGTVVRLNNEKIHSMNVEKHQISIVYYGFVIKLACLFAILWTFSLVVFELRKNLLWQH